MILIYWSKAKPCHEAKHRSCIGLEIKSKLTHVHVYISSSEGRTKL
jgi:hypothetical protein